MALIRSLIAAQPVNSEANAQVLKSERVNEERVFDLNISCTRKLLQTYSTLCSAGVAAEES
jgi:hypothetical protein